MEKALFGKIIYFDLPFGLFNCPKEANYSFKFDWFAEANSNHHKRGHHFIIGLSDEYFYLYSSFDFQKLSNLLFQSESYLVASWLKYLLVLTNLGFQLQSSFLFVAMISSFDVSNQTFFAKKLWQKTWQLWHLQSKFESKESKNSC